MPDLNPSGAGTDKRSMSDFYTQEEQENFDTDSWLLRQADERVVIKATLIFLLIAIFLKLLR